MDRYGVESGKAVLKLAHYYIGRIESDRQNWENARIHFDKSIEVDPNFVDGFLSLGQAVYHRAVFEDRLQKELRRRLLRAAVRRFGEAQEAIGRNYEELKDASKGLDLIRGRLVYKGGSFRTHLREYNSVLWAKTAGIHYWLGKALIALGEEPEALESFRRATKLAPDVAIYREAEAMLGQRVDQPSDEK
ncbi:MAG: tetratricopeptide repeat protein [Planctomycetota bacterium]|nr:tetratricopeptide repeat protein [Planctomycetota bacterium]